MKIFKRSVWACLTVYLAIWLCIAITAGVVLSGYRKTINNTLGLRGYTTVNKENSGDEDLEYYKSAYVKKDSNGNPLTVTDSNGYKHQVYDDAALRKANIEKADAVQREGATLLWNNDVDGNVGLPLAEGNKVSLFSHSSVDYAHTASVTSSGKAYLGGVSNLKQASENAGLTVNPTLWDFYDTGDGSSYVRTDFSKVNEVPWNRYTDMVKRSFSNYGDAAVVVISRVCGESGATDATQLYADTISKDYFDFSQEEHDMFANILKYKADGVFKKVIVLLNTPTGFNFDAFKNYRDKIDSCIWVGQGGWEGINEVGRILAGKSIPSGHLMDTYAYNGQSAPAAVNSIFQSYENLRKMKLKDVNFQGTYLVYAENIYVGYKYYETRYEDAVLGQGNATSTKGTVNSTDGWVYGEEVAFPFGYGAAYTTFAYENFSAKKQSDGSWKVTLTVRNTGSVAGQDAVQVYVQKPYTDYDKQYGLEQAAVNLCGYTKTGMIAPNDTEKVEITVSADSFRTYDDEQQKTYIFEKGTYYITAAQDAHEAVNNILAAKGKTPANTDGVMDAEGNQKLVESFVNSTNDFEKYSKSANGTKITNQFETTDWNKYPNRNEGETVVYLSRNDWESTYPTKNQFRFTLTNAMVEELGGNNTTSEWNHTVEVKPGDEMPKYGATNDLKFVDMKGLSYDDPAWNDLLDEMTLLEQSTLCATAFWGTAAIESISKPEDKTADGPMGIRFKMTSSDTRTMSFPANSLLAATFNDKLAYDVAAGMGEDMLHSDCESMYGTAPNLHRSLYGGRAFEYYSEDGFLSGMMCNQQTKGMQDKGVYVVIKHLALNDQETNRHGVGIWANEQSIREVYLEAFRPSVEDGNARSMMSSFTRFGTVWSGAYGNLNNQVLRGEWGFDGYVISDCSWRAYMGIIDGLMGGNDCILMELAADSYVPYAENNATVALALREAVHRILYVTVNTSAVNGIGSNTEIVQVKTWWENALDIFLTVTIVLTSCSAAMLVTSIVIHAKGKKNS